MLCWNSTRAASLSPRFNETSRLCLNFSFIDIACHGRLFT
jgi:hypothetical protein